MPSSHDYHPKIQSNGDLESCGLLDVNAIDRNCLICMNSIEFENISRYDYMVSPCSHVFHTNCLTDWMKIKMECPVCRTQLPSV